MQRIIYKIVLLGDAGVGKTSLLVRYIDDKFQDNYKATLGFDISIMNITDEETEFSLAIWDIAGQDTMSELRKSYIEGAQGTIVIYDATNRKSFENLSYWLDQMYKFAGHIPFILVGNKIDLKNDIKISTEEGQKLAELKKYNDFFETSAKTGDNVGYIFKKISKLVHDKYKK